MVRVAQEGAEDGGCGGKLFEIEVDVGLLRGAGVGVCVRGGRGVVGRGVCGGGGGVFEDHCGGDEVLESSVVLQMSID